MKVEFEKKMRIASDLLSYCHLKGATEFHLDMTAENGVSLFAIKAAPANISDEEMDQLLKNLNTPRHMEIENDYWGLMGESENFAELALVGVMSDEAEVEYKENVLTITIKRYH